MARQFSPAEKPPADRGCQHGGPRCVDCTLPHCYFEDGRANLHDAMIDHYVEIVRLRQAGYTVPRITRIVGKSQRTVERALLDYRLGAFSLEEGPAVRVGQMRGAREFFQLAKPPRFLAAGRGGA